MGPEDNMRISVATFVAMKRPGLSRAKLQLTTWTPCGFAVQEKMEKSKARLS